MIDTISLFGSMFGRTTAPAPREVKMAPTLGVELAPEPQVASEGEAELLFVAPSGSA